LATPRNSRRAACRLLVALGPVQVLFGCAKHLFVAARTVCHKLQSSCGERKPGSAWAGSAIT